MNNNIIKLQAQKDRNNTTFNEITSLQQRKGLRVGQRERVLEVQRTFAVEIKTLLLSLNGT